MTYQEYLQNTLIQRNKTLLIISWGLVAISPLILIGKLTGIFDQEDMFVCMIIFLINLVQAGIFSFFYKYYKQYTFTAILGLIMIEFMIAFLWVAKININIAWFFVPFISIMFCSKTIYLFCSITNLFIIAGALWSTIDYRSSRTLAVLPADKWFADTFVGYAIEYLFMAFSGYMLTKLLLSNLKKMYADEQEITEKEQEIYCDKLTGLWNNQYMKKYFQEHAQKGSAFAIIDLDNFKTLNDKCGHLAGNRALIGFSQILFSFVEQNPGAIASRFGGDEFTIFFPHIESESHMEYLFYELRKSCYNFFFSDAELKELRFSLGAVYINSAEIVTFEVAMNAADECLLNVKRESKNGIKYFVL